MVVAPRSESVLYLLFSSIELLLSQVFAILGLTLMNEANTNGNTLLNSASGRGRLEMVKLLISSGALMNQANNDGWTPLHRASFRGHLEIIKFLITNKANFDYKKDDGKSPIDVALNDETKEFLLKEIRWFCRRSLILIRPHNDHETNEEHKLKPLGEIITATRNAANPCGGDGVLYQLKMKITRFL